MTQTTLVHFAVALACAGTVLAGDADHPVQPLANPPDKSGYNLFHPTPRDQLRDFNPDRPSFTNGPYTVDAGHLQLETGILEYNRDRYNGAGVRTDGFAVADTVVRLGVIDRAEVSLQFSPFNYVRTKDKVTGAHTKQSGVSDLTALAKVNFFGNDGGVLAAGLQPFARFPTATQGLGGRGFAGGIGVPVQWNAPGNFQVGYEGIGQSLHLPGGGSYWDWINSVVMSHPLVGRFSTYVEFVSEVPTLAHQRWSGTVDTGLVYLSKHDWQLDAGVNVGVTKAANDLFPFVGAAWRY